LKPAHHQAVASSAAIPVVATEAGTGSRSGHWRWIICGLLFLAATINYIDRQVIGLLKPTLARDLHWSEIDYANIVIVFQLFYAAGFLLLGRMVDRIGTRKGFSVAVILWSIAAMAHAAARSVLGFSIARAGLGLGEGCNFPASIKTVAEWFPKKERALATGIFNSGTNVAVLAAAVTVPWITLRYGWQTAFLITGALGFVWVLLWLALYRTPEAHPYLSQAELAYIRSDPPDPEMKVAWWKLLQRRQTWAVAIGKFMTDPIWWLYLFWVPDFLNKSHGITLAKLGLPLVTIYMMANIGSITGGWISGALLNRGWNANAARKTALLIAACGVVPIVFAARATNLWTAVFLVGLAAASHQGWSANLYTLASDMFPRYAVGSVIGVAGMAGAVGGMFIAGITGRILQWTGSYYIVFIIAGSAYLVALAIIHTIVPKLEPAQLEEA
jgi:ACS family hexuronate transporter-like MFS transporter